MKNIFDNISKKELSNLVGENVQTYAVSENGNSYTCFVNRSYIIKVPFNKKTAISLRREINLANILKKCVLSAQTPAWRYVDLSHISQDTLPKYAAFCAVAPLIEGEHPDTLDTPLLTFSLGSFLAELHKIPAIAFSGVAATYIDVEFDYMLDTWEKEKRHKGVEKTKWKQFKKYLRNTVLTRANKIYIHQHYPVLTHADLHVGNVLVNNKGWLSGVLDFGNAVLSPSPQDIISAGAWLRHGNILVNSYYGKMGARVNAEEKQQKAWKLVSQMNKSADRMLAQFLEKERG